LAASVLSGNRNFEARVHQNIKANFLMSPPLVVAFALAGRVDIDLSTEPLGTGKSGEKVYLRDLWPTLTEIRDEMKRALQPEVFAGSIATSPRRIQNGTKFRRAPATFTRGMRNRPTSRSRRFLRISASNPAPSLRSRAPARSASLATQFTTDHISPAGAIKKTSPPGNTYREQRHLEDFTATARAGRGFLDGSGRRDVVGRD